MKARYYFPDYDDERCFDLKSIREYMQENEIEQLVIYPAKIMTGESFYYCSFFYEIGEVGEGCGRGCSEYAPRNGKNGRCKYSKNCYEPIMNKPIIIKQEQQGDRVTFLTNKNNRQCH